MKNLKFSLITLSVFFTCNCYCQKEMSGSGFGIKGGINISNLTVKSSGVSYTPSVLVGATGGFFATIPAGSGFVIQPEVLYSMLGYSVKSSSTIGTAAGTAHYNYLVVPVLIKYAFQTSGFGAYAGPQIGFLLSAKEKSGNVSNDVGSSLKSSEVAGIIGVDYTLPVGFNVSARYQLGLTNIAKGTATGESAKLNALTFTIGYRLQ